MALALTTNAIIMAKIMIFEFISIKRSSDTNCTMFSAKFILNTSNQTQSTAHSIKDYELKAALKPQPIATNRTQPNFQ